MLSVKNIYKSFNRLSILKGISFSQNKGEIIALMGKNGTGKSTLLRIIARIMKADSGTVTFNEKDLLSANSKYRNNMFYVGHEPGLYSFFSPIENLKFLLKTRDLSSKENSIEDKLDRYGLIDFIDKPIAVFSKGMLQKLKLVQIELVNPDLLLFDEPYSSLDEDGVVLVDQLIADIKMQNKSAILVLHDEYKAKKYGDFIFKLASGKISKKMLFNLIKKELLIEFRSKQIILSMLIFGLAIILIFALSTNVSSEILSSYSPGMFWLMNLFIVVLGVHRSFAYEKEFDAFSLLVSAPINRGQIFLSKWISGFIFITTTQLIVIVPFFNLLLLDIPENLLLFILTSMLINLGMMAIANLVSGIVIRSNFSEILLPLLMFPLLSPLIIAATKISSAVINAHSYEVWNVWVLIVVSIVVLFGLAGYALFDFIVEE